MQSEKHTQCLLLHQRRCPPRWDKQTTVAVRVVVFLWVLATRGVDKLGFSPRACLPLDIVLFSAINTCFPRYSTMWSEIPNYRRKSSIRKVKQEAAHYYVSICQVNFPSKKLPECDLTVLLDISQATGQLWCLEASIQQLRNVCTPGKQKQSVPGSTHGHWPAGGTMQVLTFLTMGCWPSTQPYQFSNLFQASAGTKT